MQAYAAFVSIPEAMQNLAGLSNAGLKNKIQNPIANTRNGQSVSRLAGYLVVEITQTDDKRNVIEIPATAFELEEGGDWYLDGDAWCRGFVFIAFCEGFDATLSFNVVDDTVTRSQPVSYEINGRDIHAIRTLDDSLDVGPCLRSASAEDTEYD